MIYKSMDERMNAYKSMVESSSSEEDCGKKCSTGLEPLSVADYTSVEDKFSADEYDKFFKNPIVMEAFSQHYDLTDTTTRRAILCMNEAEQATVLTNLTSKLYDNIVSKVDDIDYGEIPMSKGDVAKLINYNKMKECISLLRSIVAEYKQDTAPIDEIATALANIESRKDLFNRAFKLKVEMPIILYNTMTLAVISSVSLMIASCIEFIKTPNKDSFEICLDKVAYAKTKNNMLFGAIKSFNASCAKGDIDKAMNHVIDGYVRNESAAFAAAVAGAKTVGAAVSGAIAHAAGAIGGLGGVTTAVAGGISGAIGAIAAVLTVITLLRTVIFLLFYLRMRVSEFLEVQADLLEVNAKNVENNETMDESSKKRIVASQMKIVNFFRNLSNKISINAKKAEVDSTKDMDKEDRQKIEDNEIPDGAASSLFSL